jgi:putative DNA primase/helicase
MDFIDFARGHGLMLDHALPDGRWHRVKTEDKPKKRNGAYIWDGTRGSVRNWATMENFSTYRVDGTINRTVQRVDLVRIQAERDREVTKRANAARAAGLALSKAKMTPHPYLARKGFPEAVGMVLEGNLLIPMRDCKTNELLSLQRISEAGEKLFLPGGRTKGAVFVLGKKNYLKSDHLRYLCEGYATGLSIMEAVNTIHQQAEVWVCFSASNLTYVAERIGGNRLVVADHDASGTGQRAAEATGLPWVMSPIEGEDANDWHQRAGIWELARALRKNWF